MTQGRIFRGYLFIVSLLIAASLTACGSKEVTNSATADSLGNTSPKNTVIENKSGLPDTSLADPLNPEIKTTFASDSEFAPSENHSEALTLSATRSYLTDVLLFNGVGISTSDWQTTETIIKSAKLSYQLVNSKQLDAMTLDQMANFGVIIVPGGNGYNITSGVLKSTGVRVRQAVRDRGVGYVGMCAGAWVSVGPEALTNYKAAYGFAVAKGNYLIQYAPGGKYPEATIEDVTFADGSHRKLVWWGGPITPSWVGGVVAKYVTGEPAISQTWVGKGFVVITGAHPEAPQSWRYTAGYDSDGLDYDIALKMFKAALYRTPMPVF